MSQDLRAFFYPRHVAVIGASENRKIGHEILKNIQAGGIFRKYLSHQSNEFSDSWNPLLFRHRQSSGTDGSGRCGDSGKEWVPQAIAECGKKGVVAAVIITGGFSEAGAQGEALQKQTVEAAKRYGVRLIGYCQGSAIPPRLFAPHGLC